MKVCPSCKTQYTDDSLAFCLQDGTRLVPIEPAFTSGAEADTVVRHREPKFDNQTQSQVRRVAEPRGNGSKTTVIMVGLLAALIGVVIVLALGLAWLFWPTNQVANNTPANNRNINVPININRPSPTPRASSVPTSSLNVAFPTPTPRSNTSDDVAISQVGATVERWRAATEAMDGDSLMQNYASTVAYYRLGSASSDFVRRDKERAFKIFTSMSIEISNMTVSVSASGDQATAEFDKEWVFRGGGDLTGKARSQLGFSKIDGRWLITAERDLRVYYLNTK